MAWPELRGCGNRTITKTATVYWCRRASASNLISGELVHPADYRMIGYSGRHWRHSLCVRAVTRFWNLSGGTHSIHGSSAARKHARNVRNAWGMGRASTCFLPCIGRVGRQLFRPARPRQPSRHASSVVSCERRAGRGWLARGAWRERSGRQTATCFAPPPPQQAPSSIFPSPISCATESGRRRAGRHPPLRIECGLARATPALCPGGGVWSGRRGAAWPCALAVYCRGAPWRPA